MTLIDRTHGSAFDDSDVAACYAHRPPYPPELYRFLLDLIPGRGRALDLGCGPGKIARVLAGHFDHVDAIDPSTPMIEAGRAGLDTPANIDWYIATAEGARLAGLYDLVAAGASIHWMEHEIVFPRLAEHLHPRGMVAIISGENVCEAPWLGDWTSFVADWLKRVDRTPDEPGFAAALRSHEPWMDIKGTRNFDFPFTQDLRSFIDCQHSRATWSRSRLGGGRSAAFDEELAALLGPYSVDGKIITYRVRATLAWGQPRTQPRTT